MKHKIYVRLVDRPKSTAYAWWEITLDSKSMIQGVSEEDCRIMRCSERDFVENSALDIAEWRGYKRSECEVIFI